MKTARDSTLQSLGMIVSLLVAGLLTGLAVQVRQHYEQASIGERIEALPVIDAEVVLRGRYDDGDVMIASYVIGFALYLIGIESVLLIVLPNLYRNFRDRKRHSDLV